MGKRFRVRFEQEDGSGEIVNEKGVELTAREVVDLLNKLYDENERFEVIFYGDVINCVRDENGKEYNLQELISILMDQQATIRKLQDICGESDSGNAKLRIENKKLKEENEQLRQIIKDIVCATDQTYTKNTSIFKVTVVFDGKMYNQIRSCLYE